MSYTWTDGETITAVKLNQMTPDLTPYRTAAAQDVIDAGKIPAPSSPATGAFLVWNGTAWTAQVIENASEVAM